MIYMRKNTKLKKFIYILIDDREGGKDFKFINKKNQYCADINSSQIDLC